MKNWLLQVDRVLRGEDEVGTPAQLIGRWLSTILVFGFLYGAAMGSFQCFSPQRSIQVVFAGVKVPLLLSITFSLCIPGFFVFNTLMGLRDDFGRVVRAIITAQMGMTILLSSLAPITILWNVGAENHTQTILFNAVMFGIALIGSQILLRRHYRPLITKDMRHRLLLTVWGGLYAFTGIQLAWVLRPFIASPDRPITFFREDSWGNAYMVVFQLIGELFGQKH
jgi:hypothetical protein